MTPEKTKRMMDACYLAKRVREMLPELPAGVAPSYIHYLDIIEQLQDKGTRVKISDISDILGIPRPGVTRTVKEMEKKGLLRKISSEEDARMIYIVVTDEGRKLSDKYNKRYFGELSELLDDISEEEIDNMIKTTEKIYNIMNERRINLE